MITNQEIESIELRYINLDDYEELKSTMIAAYSSMPDAYWREHQISTLVEKFPEGQVLLTVNGKIAGCALSIIVDYSKFEGSHTYSQITGNYTFSTHTSKGNVLYGIDILSSQNLEG